jgi:type II secretory pathway pseudopilin PulG
MNRVLKKLGLILAVAIVLLVLAMIPAVRAVRVQVPVARTQVQLQAIQAACNSYFDYYGEWPASLSDLDHNRSNIVFILWPKWGTNDGWGRPIIYRAFDSGLGHGTLLSYGRDGRVSGEGPDADIEFRFGDRKK